MNKYDAQGDDNILGDDRYSAPPQQFSYPPAKQPSQQQSGKSKSKSVKEYGIDMDFEASDSDV